MKGSTLIEMLIYIALLGILMVGVIPSAYMLMRKQHPQVQIENTELLLNNTYE